MMKDKPQNIQGLERFTGHAKKIIAEATSQASIHNDDRVRPIHLFYSLLVHQKGTLKDLFEKIGLDIESTLKRVEGILKKSLDLVEVGSSEKVSKIYLSPEFRHILNESLVIASELGQKFIASEHLFLSMFKLRGERIIDEIVRAGVSYDYMFGLIKSQSAFNVNEDLVNNEMPFAMKPGPGVMGNPFLTEGQDSSSQYYRDMNEMAMNGYFPNITGRDGEVRRLVHVLSRKTKNNAILVGDAGVGKTAIVEGFVSRLVRNDLPASLNEKTVLSVDIAGIIAGARLRGDVEERVQEVINEALDSGNVILFIDEIHNIIGAGSAGSKEGMDVANILKPYLTSGELTVIGATTADEYSKYFENDSALSRRFQPIYVDELDVESAISIVNGLRKEFEDYHNVKIASDAVESAVKLSYEFIKDRYLPDKAIDLIDEAAASIKIGREVAIEPELSKLGEKLIEVQSNKQKAFESKNFDQASKMKFHEERIIDEISLVVEGRKSVKKKYPKTVTSDFIRQIIVDWTKIPIAASDISDKAFKDLDKDLRSKIIGQDHVIRDVALAVQRSHLGLGHEKRPLASFLFLGPTGVGKTELAKTIASELFGSADLIYQVNMSELMESHSISKLIGSPPGYVGYDEGGQLTKFVRRKPYSVVLFDEVEKAHPDVLNLLLQILEEGSLMDGKGKKVSFSNVIIVMTSNIGAEKVSNDSKIGFDVSIQDDAKGELDQVFEEMKEKLLEELRNTLRPELLNRIDSINVFRGLNKEDSLKITGVVVNELKLRLIKKGLVINVSSDTLDYINEQGYSKEYGGRNIRRKVQEIIENGLAKFLVENKFSVKRKDLLEIDVDITEVDKLKEVIFSFKKK